MLIVGEKFFSPQSLRHVIDSPRRVAAPTERPRVTVAIRILHVVDLHVERAAVALSKDFTSVRDDVPRPLPDARRCLSGQSSEKAVFVEVEAIEERRLVRDVVLRCHTLPERESSDGQVGW